jgi:hypothetical protein
MTTLHHAFSLSLTGHLDPRVGRWKWLFKWLLAIPHPRTLYDLILGLNRTLATVPTPTA